MNRGTHLYPESTTLITEIEATGVQLKPETHMECSIALGGGPRVVVSTAAFHAPEFGVRFPVSAVVKKQKMFLPHPRVKVSIVGSLRDREVACSASDRRGSNFESCVWRTVSSQSSQSSPGPVWPICAQRWPTARFISFFSIALIVKQLHFNFP